MARFVPVAVAGGMAVHYVAGVAFAAVEAHQVGRGRSFGATVSGLEPWPSLLLVPAALAVLAGFGAFASGAWRMTAGYREAGRRLLKAAPGVYTGRIPRRVRCSKCWSTIVPSTSASPAAVCTWPCRGVAPG